MKKTDWFQKGIWNKKDDRNSELKETYKKLGAVKTAKLFNISRTRVYQIVFPTKYTKVAVDK